MNNKHILNIGYPKCGTTWCWHMLAQQTWFAVPREKENNDLIRGVTVADYAKSYINTEITANFSPANFAVDRYIIKQLSELPTTTASIIVRNPFDLYWSLYNFLPPLRYQNYNDYVSNLIQQSWFHRPAHIIKRWQQFFTKDKFHIFFYDDMQKNSCNFFHDYCEQMQLPHPIIRHSEKVNVTRYNQKYTQLSPAVVAMINQQIDNLQSCVNRDVLKWKQR